MAPFGRFSARLALVFGLLVVVSSAATDMFLTRSLKSRFVAQMTDGLMSQARLIGEQAGARALEPRDAPRLEALAHRLKPFCGCRITFISAQGVVLGDSELAKDALADVENHATRPEVSAALSGRPESAVRHSHTIGADLLYAAVPAAGPGSGVVRLSLPLEQVDRRLSLMRRAVFLTSTLLALVAVLAALVLAGEVARPVGEMAAVAERLSAGDYGARVKTLTADELGVLGRALNQLAATVEDTISELSRDKAQLESILSNVVEAIAAVDGSGQVIDVNAAGCALFSVRREDAIGRPLPEVLKHPRLQALLERVIQAEGPVIDELAFPLPGERVFEAHGVPFVLEGSSKGALLVLHEITRLRQLERVRREFVANVSHELRTPLASIRAFAETLKAGAIDDAANRMDFLDSIDQDSQRLSALVDDLLELSSIESGKRQPKKALVSLLEIARKAVNRLKPLADRRKVALVVEANAELPRVMADEDQFLRVYTNLIDNAVKFSPKGGRVVVAAKAAPGSVEASVRDSGAGIPEADLPRLFERFYRVDKARSREMGGTGLGLSIVKHIVEAHGGSVSVESKLGEGATFRFTVPV